MTEPKVYAVVLAWNQLQETKECLNSLSDMDSQPYSTIVVDNGSMDGTSDIITQEFPDVTVVRSETNLGVAGGYNIGIEYALNQGADYVLILNNDTVFDNKFLDELLFVVHKYSRVGIVQPKIYHYFGDRSKLWIVGGHWQPFPPGVKLIGSNKTDSIKYSKDIELEFVPSCALLISREVLESVGFFDPEYFFYFDDWDFSLRVRRAGFKIYFAANAKMWHKVSVSTVKSDKSGKWWYVMGQSSARFFSLHYNGWILLGATIWFVVREIVKRKANRIVPYVVGVMDGYASQRKWVPEPRTKSDISIINAGVISKTWKQ